MDDLKLLTEPLPTSLLLGSRLVGIDARWHVQIDVADHIADPEIPEPQKVAYLFKRFYRTGITPALASEAIRAWNEFYSMRDPRLEAGRAKPRVHRPCLDFYNDARIIVASFQSAYGIDLFSSDMHWWRFLCLLEGLSSSSALSERISLRARKPESGKYANAKANQSLREAQAQIRIVPRYTVTEEERQAQFQRAIDSLVL